MKSISPSHKPPTYSASHRKPSTKRFNPRTSPPSENPDRKRKHQVIAHSELSRLYGNIYIPDGYLEYSGDKSVDFVRIALRQREPEAPQDIGGDPDPRAKPQRAAQNRTPKPQIAHRDPRRPHQNHRQPNRRAGQNDINPSNAGEVSNLAIVKLSIILYMPVIFTNKLKVVGTRRGFSVKPSSVGGNSDSRLFGTTELRFPTLRCFPTSNRYSSSSPSAFFRLRYSRIYAVLFSL